MMCCDREPEPSPRTVLLLGPQQGEVADRHRAWLRGLILSGNAMVFVGSSCPGRVGHATCHQSRGGTCCIAQGANGHEHLRNQCLLHPQTYIQCVCTWHSHHTHTLAWERLVKHVLLQEKKSFTLENKPNVQLVSKCGCFKWTLKLIEQGKGPPGKGHFFL